jgi:hypothetical protein
MTKIWGAIEGTVYLKKSQGVDPFTWGGGGMRLDEGAETTGGIAVTTRFDPGGGMERTGLVDDAPGAATTSLIMKRAQGDRVKDALKSCLWDIDQRFHCEGKDRDSPFRWEEITRYCNARVSERALTGTSWDVDEDAVATFSVTAEYVDDIYRVTGVEATVGGSSTSTSMSSTSTSLSTTISQSTSLSTSSTSISQTTVSVSTSSSQSTSLTASTTATSISYTLSYSTSLSTSLTTSTTSQSTSTTTTLSASLSTSTSVT